CADPVVDLGDRRIAPVEVAGFAGAEVRDSDVVGDLGRAAAGIDPLDQRGAGPAVDEAANDEQVELAGRDALDSGRGGEPGRWPGEVSRRSPAPVAPDGRK